jgi:hypothetical protein
VLGGKPQICWPHPLAGTLYLSMCMVQPRAYYFSMAGVLFWCLVGGSPSTLEYKTPLGGGGGGGGTLTQLFWLQ